MKSVSFGVSLLQTNTNTPIQTCPLSFLVVFLFLDELGEIIKKTEGLVQEGYNNTVNLNSTNLTPKQCLYSQIRSGGGGTCFKCFEFLQRSFLITHKYRACLGGLRLHQTNSGAATPPICSSTVELDSPFGAEEMCLAETTITAPKMKI
jgi:hypothetical protein